MFCFLLGIAVGAVAVRLGGPLLRLYVRKEAEFKKEIEQS